MAGRHARGPQVPNSTSSRRSQRAQDRARLPLLAGGALALAIAGAGTVNATSDGVELSTMQTLAGLANVGPRTGVSAVGPLGDELLEVRNARAASERASRAAHREALEAKRKAAAKKARTAAKKRTQAAAKRRAALARARALARRYTLPVSGYHLTARFNAGGGLWAGGRHTGLDFAAPAGTPVRAVGRGRIVDTGWAGAYGWRLIIRHPDGTKTWYCHLATFLRTSGQVAVGQMVARVGSTGNVTGPHLHLEVHPGGGGPVDPYSWLVTHGLQP